MRSILRAGVTIAALTSVGPAAGQIQVSPTHPNGEVTLVVDFEVKPEKTQRFEAAFALSVRCSRLEPGNITFAIHRVVGAETRYVLYEVWRSTAALESHFARPYTRALFAMFDEALVRPVTEGGLRFIGDLSPAPRPAPIAGDPAADPACR
jgi:quinol monooxygenase YgiN